MKYPSKSAIDDIKIGRPPKDANKRKSAKIYINLTEAQKAKLINIANEREESLSQICLQALKNEKLI